MTLEVMNVPRDRKAYYKAYNDANKEKRATYYQANKERILEEDRIQRLENLEEARAKDRAYSQANKHVVNAKASVRRSRRRKANEIIDSEDRWVLNEIYELAKLRNVSTKFAWEVDHIQPLSKGGKHSLDNLQVVPRQWNRRKHNRNADRFFGAT
jgi:5-methylcytosine-specific restriction endonuclease McrA